MRKNKVQHKQGFIQGIKSSRALYLLLLPSFIIFLLFTYYPMYGVIIAFKDFSPAQGILGSPWVGFKNFIQYFNSYQFWPTIRNTIVISLYTIVVTFPLPVFLALMCNQIRARRFKKFFQVSTYLPHFISTVVMCGMIILFLSPSTGIIAKLAELFGFTLPNLMGSASAFPSIYVWTEAWQHVGWDSMRPYMREQMRLVHEKGTPVMRPYFYDYPEDKKAWEVEDSYLFGTDFLVAPVLEAGAREREVYLPKGEVWIDVWTGEERNGGETITVSAPLEKIPVFAKKESEYLEIFDNFS